MLKILCIGNSFSDDAMEYVYQIAQDLGVEDIKLGNLYIAGCSLATHLSHARDNSPIYEYRTNSNGTWTTTANYRMKDAIESENWDFITMQQASGSSGLPNTYDDLQKLIDIVKGLCPCAKLAWHMTWAYQGNSDHTDFPNYHNKQDTMYQAIVRAVQERVLNHESIEIVIPSGTSVQNARTSYIGDHLTRDGYHLTYAMGRYIAGLTYVHALTGLPIDKVMYKPDGLGETEQLLAIESVQNAFKSKYCVTQSEYVTEPCAQYKFDIILQGGQSNAEGYGTGPVRQEFMPQMSKNIFYLEAEKQAEHLPECVKITFANVPFVIRPAREQRQGEETIGNFALSFGECYEREKLKDTDRKLLIIKAAVGGTGFVKGEWRLQGVLYQKMLEMVDYALSLNPENRVVGFLWHQGECDAYEHNDPDVFAHQLEELINDVRKRYGEELPFIAGDFVYEWKEKYNLECNRIVGKIKDAIEKSVNAGFVETADLLSNNQKTGNGDDIHFCREALYILGRRYYAAYKDASVLH